LRVISLSFIVLPELVKHILVAGVVRRNIKFNVKISNISIKQKQTRFTVMWRMTLWCRSALKVVRNCRSEVLVFHFSETSLRKFKWPLQQRSQGFSKVNKTLLVCTKWVNSVVLHVVSVLISFTAASLKCFKSTLI